MTLLPLTKPQQSTIERRGKSTVSSQSTEFECHRVSCVLVIRGDGTKLLLRVIMKGSRNILCEKNGVLLFETEKAWSNQKVLRKYICRVLPMPSRGNRRGLVVWDSVSTHRALSMKTFLLRQRIDQVMVPFGCTCHLQSLDLVVNKPFVRKY